MENTNGGGSGPRRSLTANHRRLDFLAPSTDNLNQNHPPPTPPYRRDLSHSQEFLGLGRAMPPDYRSEYNVSREAVDDNGNDEKSRFPTEKVGFRRSESPEPHQRNHQHHHHLHTDDEEDEDGRHLTSTSAKPSTQRIHYPDTDGKGGALFTVQSPIKRNFSGGFPSPDSPSRGGGTHGRHSRASSIASSDADDDEEEIYDWSDEEDLVDQEAKYQKQMGNKPKKKGFSFGRFVTFFFSTLIGSIITTAALVAVPILLRILWLNKDKENRQYIFDNVSAWFYWAGANVLVSWWLASIIDVLPHIFLFLVDIVWGNVSEVMKSRVEQYQTGKGWVKPLFYAAEAWVSWSIIFNGIYDLYDSGDESRSRASYTPRVYQGIRFLFFFVLVVCVEKILIQMIAFNFHQTAFRERLDAVAKALKVLDQLKDYKPKRKYYPGQSASGYSTPVASGVFGFKRGFGFGGSTPVNEGGPDYMRSGARTPAEIEEGWLGDSEEKEKGGLSSSSAAAKGKKKKRESGNGWFSSNKGKQASDDHTGSGDDALEMKSHRKDQQQQPLQSRPNSSLAHSYPPSSPPVGKKGHGEGNEGSSDGPGFAATAAKALKAVVLHDARNLRSASEVGDAEEDEGVGGGLTSLNSAHEAKKLARDLYHAFRADRRRTYLIPSDFYPAYSTPDEAKDAFRVFDKDDNGDITRAEIKTTLVKVYKERRFLARSLRDVSAAVTTLDRIMLVAAMLVLFFISLSVFGVSLGSSLSSIYTVFIAASFIFKGAASNAFDAIMFLFVTHPFDTGDRCFIDSENLVVRKMGLFATTFTRSDGTQTYYFNSMLFTKFIMNARRSANMAENLEMQVNWKTPLSKLDALEKLLNEWIQSDEKRWYVPGVSYCLQRIEFQRNLEITIGIGHNGNWQDWGLRLARKTAFHAAVQYYSNQLGITWSESPQPVLITDNDQLPFLPEEEVEIIVEPTSPGGTNEKGSAGPVAPQAPQQSVHAMLGFAPPPAGKSGLRMRKAKSKKGLVGNMGD